MRVVGTSSKVKPGGNLANLAQPGQKGNGLNRFPEPRDGVSYRLHSAEHNTTAEHRVAPHFISEDDIAVG